jgi:hypothetical protein
MITTQRVPRFVELKNGVLLNTERLRERPARPCLIAGSRGSNFDSV